MERQRSSGIDTYFLPRFVISILWREIFLRPMAQTTQEFGDFE
jgi:hypothetical protein